MTSWLSWQEFTDQVPEFAARAQARLQAHTHLTMATIRADGGPRISGNEIRFRGGQLFLAGMGGSRRFADLRRDPRVAIHSGSDDPGEIPATWLGDAKVTGVAREVTEAAELAAFFEQEAPSPEGPAELFRVQPNEVTWVGLSPAADKLVIETWTPDGGLVRRER